jgi:hypothetical protein
MNPKRNVYTKTIMIINSLKYRAHMEVAEQVYGTQGKREQKRE